MDSPTPLAVHLQTNLIGPGGGSGSHQKRAPARRPPLPHPEAAALVGRLCRARAPKPRGIGDLGAVGESDPKAEGTTWHVKQPSPAGEQAKGFFRWVQPAERQAVHVEACREGDETADADRKLVSASEDLGEAHRHTNGVVGIPPLAPAPGLGSDMLGYLRDAGKERHGLIVRS